MSTTLEVYPSTDRIPTVGEVLDAGARELEHRLRLQGVERSVRLSAELNRLDRRSSGWIPVRACEAGDPLWCGEDESLWITIDGVDGGTDLHVDHWREDGEEGEPHRLYEGPRPAGDTPRYLTTGYCWYFRRSVGQPGVINLAYGLLAGCLGQITDGLIYSDDSGWDYSGMPYRPDEFLARYFVPGGTDDAHWIDWVRRCLTDIEDDFDSSR